MSKKAEAETNPKLGGRYKEIMVDGKRKLEHVHVWEQAHGPKPEGCDIHHIDGNGKNNALENLVCLTKSEHKSLHAKLKLEGRDVIDSTDPVIIASRQRSNADAKAHRQAHLEEERAKDRAEYQRNKETKQRHNREFYQRNRTTLRAQQAEYERQHKPERAARNAAYYAEHTDERKEYAREYRAKNRERIAEKQREHRLAHQDEIKAFRISYRAVHAANERLRRAIRNNLPEEDIAQRRAEVEQAKIDFHNQKKGASND